MTVTLPASARINALTRPCRPRQARPISLAMGVAFAPWGRRQQLADNTDEPRHALLPVESDGAAFWTGRGPRPDLLGEPVAGHERAVGGGNPELAVRRDVGAERGQAHSQRLADAQIVPLPARESHIGVGRRVE